MKDFDYAIGEKTHPLKKKNVQFYCNKLLEYAHDGMSLDYFLYDFHIRKSEWDRYVEKHKPLQVALEDARARAKGKAFHLVFQRMKVEINPSLMKAYADHMLGWNSSKDDGLADLPPANIQLVLSNPSKPVSTGKKKGNGGSGEHAVIVQATGQSGGNGKGNGRG